MKEHPDILPQPAEAGGLFLRRFDESFVIIADVLYAYKHGTTLSFFIKLHYSKSCAPAIRNRWIKGRSLVAKSGNARCGAVEENFVVNTRRDASAV